MNLPYRQIHLDFHTSEQIDGIAAAWDKDHWQRTLRDAHVNSVNVFAVCHHGWSYYDSTVTPRHPHLPPDLDLTRAQVDACHEIGMHTQVYCTSGLNNRVAHENPQWRAINSEGTYYGFSRKPTDAGFHLLCFNTPYLDFLCEQIREIALQFPDTDGLWLDIVHKRNCHCRWCMDSMNRQGLDPTNPGDMAIHADNVLQHYYRRTLQALREVHPTMRMTQNSGGITLGDRRVLEHVTHLELESLPTWGWGYDHFPMTAKYAQATGKAFLGMTGKFHTYWGEFGGYKHPNALRYECAAMLAYGARCCIGDQLHPDGLLDESTYANIGAAYAEVAQKESWCIDTVNVADVGLLSSVALDPGHVKGSECDTGATRMLLEGHILFDMLDAEMDFTRYKALVISDDARINAPLKAKLDAYLEGGGRILFTGRSPLDQEGNLLFDLGAELVGPGAFSLDYILPMASLQPDFVHEPMIEYNRCQRLQVTDGSALGEIFEPYFERAWNHFCSHQHAPPRRQGSGYACGVAKGGCMWLAMDVFNGYYKWGQVANKHFVLACLRQLLGDAIGLRGNLPSTARVTLMHQAPARRHVLHLLHANLVQRGTMHNMYGVQMIMQVIEDLAPCCDVRVAVRVDQPLARVTLEPQGVAIPFTVDGDRISLAVDRFDCHQMVVLAHA